MVNHAGSARSGSRVVATCLLPALVLVARTTSAEWEGVSSDDYWWPYNLYLALLWIVPLAYVAVGRVRRWWRDRRAIRRLGQ